MIFVPIIMLIFVGMMLISSFGTAIGNVASGGQVMYEESVMQEYADDRYKEIFGATDDSSILVVFLTNEECDGYYAIAWVGYDLKPEIYDLFGGESAPFSQMMLSTINSTYYGKSLPGDFSSTMNKLASRIESFGYDSSYKPGKHAGYTQSRLVNYSSLDISESVVNESLEDFTERTGIPAVILVDEMEDALGKYIRRQDIILVVIFVALLGFVVFLVVKAYREKKKYGTGGTAQNNQNRQNGYGGGGFGF